MVFSVENSNKSFFLFLNFFIMYFVLYLLFVPTFENPDEVLHYQHVLESTSLEGNLYGDGNLYYYLMNKAYTFFEQIVMQNSNISLHYNQEFRFFNDDYRFYHQNTIVDSQLLLMRLINFSFISIFFMLYVVFFKTKLNNLLFFSLLLFPGIIAFFTAINPDNLNIMIAFLISLFMFRKKYLVAFSITIMFFPFLDRSIITFIVSLLFYFTIILFKKKIMIWIIYISTVLILFSSLVYIKEILYGIHTEYEPLKSIFTLVVSYYGLLGSMSIKASYIEYFMLFFLLFFYVKDTLYPSIIYSSSNKLGHFILIYFIVWNFILVIGTSLDQGRFFYPIHFIFIYTIIDRYKNIIIKRYNLIIFWIIVLSFLINIKFIIKLILLGDII